MCGASYDATATYVTAMRSVFCAAVFTGAQLVFTGAQLVFTGT
jgi:hypothetical protein